MKFKVIVSEGEDGWYVVECPALPGCVSQGKTLEEAIENIKDAIEGYLEVLNKEVSREELQEIQKLKEESLEGEHVDWETLKKELFS